VHRATQIVRRKPAGAAELNVLSTLSHAFGSLARQKGFISDGPHHTLGSEGIDPVEIAGPGSCLQPRE
jgi:hypothetical protein